MSDKRLKIPVGEVEEVAESGSYIAVKSANVKLDIHIDGEGTQLLSQGDAWYVDGGFSGFTIENYGAVDADVLLAVGRGSFRSGQIVGSIDLINSIVNPVTVNQHDIGSIINPVKISRILPHEYLGHFQFYSAVGMSSAVVLPAANTNGVIVSNMICGVANGGIAAVFANNAMPASMLDNTINKVLVRAISGWTNFGEPKDEVFIPAGEGVYAMSTLDSIISFDYEAL